MRKLFLTMTIALSTLVASAQFMVVSTVIEPADDDSWGISNFTNNIGVAYKLNNGMFVGAMKNGEDFDLFGRYEMNKNMFISAKAPIEDMFDNLTMGVGYSFAVCPAFFIEPNYSMNLDGDNGKLNIGLSYRF